MTFVVRVEGRRWRRHLAEVRDAVETASGGRLVPVVKGSGYGLGQGLVAAESDALGVDCVAVGTVVEVAEVAAEFPRDVLVLEPYEPRDEVAASVWDAVAAAPYADRVVRTVASAAALAELARAPASGSAPVRVLVEGLTSVRRFGLDDAELLAALDDSSVQEALADGRLAVAGLALHLPLAAGTPPRVDQVVAWARRWAELRERLRDTAPGTDAGMADAATLWVSHLADDELASVREALPGADLRPRVGTRLWLGDRDALKAAGVVLAVHPLDGAVPAGYRQRKGPRDGTLVVVGGGTSHGVALAAPTPATTLRQRAVAAGTGALEAAGRALSPFRWAGARRWFAEPPHMHVSLLWLPGGTVVPRVGDELPCEVRFTTLRPDAVVVSDR